MMPHWRDGKWPMEDTETDRASEPVRVVDKLPKVPPSQIVFLRYDPDDQSGGNYWRGTGEGWEPAVPGTTVPRNRVE
jgi:hypothetical protein